MIQSRKFLVVSALALASIAMASPDGVTLRKDLRQGVESFHMQATTKQTISLPGGTDQDMGMTSVASYTYKIGAVDTAADQAPVEVTTKIEKIDLDGPLADTLAGQKDKMLVSTTASGKLDSRGRFTADPNSKIDPRGILTGSSNANLIGPYIEFPEKPVNIGDTWDVAIPKGPTTSKEDQKLTAKLVSESVVDGVSVYTLSLNGTIKTNIDVGEIMKANPIPEAAAMGFTDMVITGSLDVSGDVTVAKATGQTLTMNLKMNSKQEASIAALGDTKIPFVGTSTIKFTLDK